jgi:hypothetical protein
VAGWVCDLIYQLCDRCDRLKKSRAGESLKLGVVVMVEVEMAPLQCNGGSSARWQSHSAHV